DVAVRHFALEHLGTLDAREVIAGFLQQVNHADQQLRRKALDLLSASEKGQEALAEALRQEANVDRAWVLARALGQRVASFTAGWRKDVFQRIGPLLEAGDHRADPLLYLLRQADAKELRDRLEERALALRKKKAYD